MKRIYIFVWFLFFGSYVLTAEDYWGLRNINISYKDAVYEGFNPQFIAWGFVWDRLERPDDTFNWTYIDEAVDFTAKYNAQTVILLTPASSWASGGEPKAPDDLERRISLDAEVPERGYSESLYDYVYKIIDRIAKRNPNVLRYLRYGNEPQYSDHWIVSDQTYKRDVEDFVRCLRTVYKAAHKAAADNRASIKVSHGGFYYNNQLERIWYEYGEEIPDKQDSILTVFNSRYERQWPKDINTWNDFARRMQSRSAMPPTYWMDVIAGQTEWLDWFDIHYHFKPRFIFDDMMAFEKAVKDSGGTLNPWFAAEAAMQIEEAGNTLYEERFHAGDMVRKWIFGIDAGLKGICTPILGMPPDRFFGLFTEDDKRYMSADAYQFVHSLIHPVKPPIRFDSNRVITYRFEENEKFIDFIWLDALFDTLTATLNHKLHKPEVANEDEYYCRVFDILGNEMYFFGFKEITELSISQEPVILVWETSSNPRVRKKYEPADGYIYHGVGWNYKNSVPIYLEMMPDNQQPLLFQTMSAIPGTRELTVEKVLQGLRYSWQDINQQFVEYGVHFHKTQDEPYDSLFAFTDELDHYIDTLAIAFKQHSKPFFLRIGGEMNGSWNNYTPYSFPKAFRKLVIELRKRGVDNFATVWCYEPAAEADFADSTKLGWKWYPGDDVVDWFGLDVFPLRDFGPDEPDSTRSGISPKGKSELFLKFASDKGYPVYINETTAHSEHIIPDSEDPGNVEGKKIWEHWFVPFFQFLANHPEIKALNYINLDWTPIEKWKHWGDARLEINSYIKNNWITEMKKPKYIHKGYDIGSDVSEVEEYFAEDEKNFAYPNPFSDFLLMNISNYTGYTSIYIYDIHGNTVYTGNTKDSQIGNLIIDTKKWAAGLYIIKLHSFSNVIVKKLLKVF